MKFDKYIAFHKYLDSLKGPMPSIYAVLMPHVDERKEVLKTIIEKFKKSKPSLQLEHIEAEGLGAKELLCKLATQDLFSKEQLFVIEPIDKMPLGAFEALIGYVKQHQEVAVVMLGQQLPNSKLHEQLKDRIALLALSAEKPWERHDRIKHWAYAYIASMSKKVEEAALEYLLEVTQLDFISIKQEIDKWACYNVKKHLLDMADLHKVCQLKVVSKQWAVSESIVWGFDAKAIMESLDDGVDQHELLGMLGGLRYHVHIGLQMKEMDDAGASYQDIVQQFSQLQPKTFDKYYGALKKLPVTFFIKALKELMHTEFQFKTMSSDARVLWAQLVMKLQQMKVS